MCKQICGKCEKRVNGVCTEPLSVYSQVAYGFTGCLGVFYKPMDICEVCPTKGTNCAGCGEYERKQEAAIMEEELGWCLR